MSNDIRAFFHLLYFEVLFDVRKKYKNYLFFALSEPVL